MLKIFIKLRDNYRRCLRKREQATRSGAGLKKLPTCDFFLELSFLHDSITGIPTETNLFTPLPSPISFNQVQSDSNIDNLSTSPPASSSFSPVSTVPAKKSKKKSEVDELLMASVAADLKKEGERQKEDNDSDVLFCKSLVEQFRDLTKKQKKEARIKIMQVFLEYDD